VYKKCFKFVFESIANERGRHRGLQAKERICKLHVCLKEVEDEIHFLLKCEALQNVCYS
jgi:hypothetical protein